MTMSKTVEAAIRNNFPGKSNAGIRSEIRSAVASGSVLGLASRFALTTSGKLGIEAVQAAINASNPAAIVCGKTIQIDRSGVGANWRNLPAADLTDDLADILAAEILDSPKDYWRVDVGGVHYRWQ